MSFNLTKEEIRKEILKCGKDPDYFLHNYVKITHPDRGIIPFKTYDFQKDLLKDFHDHRFNIILKSRQLGISTIVAGYICWMMLFYREKNILVMATKLVTAIEIVDKVKDMIKSTPSWLRIAEIQVDNKTKLELSNGSKIQGIPTSKDAGRGQALSLLVIDEAAHVDDMDDLWTGLYPTISTGGRCIALSSPLGVGNWFHKTYIEAVENKNNFHGVSLPWYVHPDRDDKWFETETRNMSKRKISQEYECVTGDTRIVTKDGYKNIIDINLGDEVLTHKGNFKKVINKMSKVVDRDEIYKISLPYSRTNPVYITKNHPLLIAKKPSITNKKIKEFIKNNEEVQSWHSLSELEELYGNYIVPQYMNLMFPKISKSILSNKQKSIDLASLQITKEFDSSSVRYHRQEGKNKRFVEINYQFGKLIGLFLSEGNYLQTGSIQFSFHKDETELINFIQEFCKNYNFRYSIHPRKETKCTVVIVYNKFLVEILKTFINGKKCYDKHLNNIIYDTNEKFIDGIISGIWLGDGLHKPINKNIISLANEKLIYQLRLLMFYRGFITRVSNKYKNSNKNKTQYLLELNNVNNKNIEEILESGININSVIGARSVENNLGWWSRLSNIEKCPKELEKEVLVYNIEVEEDNSYICENLVVHNCNFNSSGETVINNDDIASAKKQICDPKEKGYVDRNYHIWEKFSNDGSYLISADVARGDGKDFSVFHVINVKTMEQVAEYQGKIDLDSFARLLYMTGLDYGTCMIVVENNNIGFSVLTKLIDSGYKNVFYTSKGNEVIDQAYAPYSSAAVPGFTTTMKTRPLIIAKLEEFIRNKMIKINSSRTVNEFDTFIWNNGRPEAQKGYNDDLIMSLAIACWIRDTVLINNEKNVEYHRAFLGSITKSNSQLVTSIPGMMQYEKDMRFDEQKKQYLQYAWLFKG